VEGRAASIFMVENTGSRLVQNILIYLQDDHNYHFYYLSLKINALYLLLQHHFGFSGFPNEDRIHFYKPHSFLQTTFIFANHIHFYKPHSFLQTALIFTNHIHFYNWLIRVSYDIGTCILPLGVLFNDTFFHVRHPHCFQ
jgi:hypothetical protein